MVNWERTPMKPHKYCLFVFVKQNNRHSGTFFQANLWMKSCGFLAGTVVLTIWLDLCCSDWYQLCTPYSSSREEDWIPYLKKLRLSSLCTSDIDYKSGHLEESLILVGQHLTVLHLQVQYIHLLDPDFTNIFCSCIICIILGSRIRIRTGMKS